MAILKYRENKNSPWQDIPAIKGEKGADGTMSFADLTEEQKASLKGADGYTPVKGVDYWTEADKQEIIDEVGGSGSGGSVDVDLSDYYTKEQTQAVVETAIASIEHPQPDLSTYAKKSEIPSLEGYATEDYVTDAISNLDINTDDINLENYYTKDQVDKAINGVSGVNEVHVGTEEPASKALLWINPEGSEDINFVTKDYVDSLFASFTNAEEGSY